MELLSYYLLIGLVLSALGCFLRGRAWARSMTSEFKEAWWLYLFVPLVWPLGLDVLFIHNTPVTRGEMTRDELAQHWRN